MRRRDRKAEEAVGRAAGVADQSWIDARPQQHATETLLRRHGRWRHREHRPGAVQPIGMRIAEGFLDDPSVLTEPGPQGRAILMDHLQGHDAGRCQRERQRRAAAVDPALTKDPFAQPARAQHSAPVTAERLAERRGQDDPRVTQAEVLERPVATPSPAGAAKVDDGPDPWGVARDRCPSLCPRLPSIAPSGAKMSNLQTTGVSRWGVQQVPLAPSCPRRSRREQLGARGGGGSEQLPLAHASGWRVPP